ncbi:MAG TPA: c-type cytochrome [Vicinamibacterales bacterium]|nr:c-type cytochrome [Vicinamibacterales bacterium]
MHSSVFGRLSATALAVFLGVLVARAGVDAQIASSEHPGQYTQAEIDAGSRLYARTCVGCHGPNGDMVTGIDLRRGVFRRSSSDEDLAKVITTGVSGAGMPGFPLQPSELSSVIAFIRAGFDPAGTAVKVGNAARGHDLFVGKGQCTTCHRVNGVGPRVAPDLSDVGAARTPAALQRTLMDPVSQMMPINRPVRVVLKNGKTLTGRRLNEDTFTVQIIDQDEQLRSIDKSTIRTMAVETTSPMPSYAKTLTPDEMSDMIAYLLTLRGI